MTPTTQNVVAAGGGQTASVTTATGCAWTAVSNNTSWITVTGGSSGTGNGTVNYNVAANTATSSRPGTLTVAGQTLDVTQAGVCSFTVTPTTQNVVAGGGAQTATVTTTSGCAWTAASNNTSWITVTSGSSGTGNGTVSYSVAANTGTSSRPGSLTIAGQTLNVTQAAVGCSFTLTPMTQDVPAAGGPQTASVTTGPGCAWTAVSNNSVWLRDHEREQWDRQRDGFLQCGGEGRELFCTGTMTIAGQTLTVNQNGAGACNFTLAPTSQNVVAAGGA